MCCVRIRAQLPDARMRFWKLILPLLALVNLWAAESGNKTEPPKAQSTPATATAKFKTVGVAEFEQLRKNTNNVVLDVRTPKEFADSHIPGATNIDVNAPDFNKRVSALDPNKTYLVHCASGVRSAKACEKLGQMSFTQLYNLDGGFRAWEKTGNKGER